MTRLTLQQAHEHAMRHPDQAEAWYQLGMIAFGANSIDLAVAAYQKVLSLRPDSADAANNLGGALQRQGKINETIVQFRLACRLRPEWSVSQYNLGLALIAARQMDQAIEALQTATKLEPPLPQAWNDLGSAFRVTGRLEQSVAAYRQAITIQPEYSQAHTNFISTCIQLGNALTAARQIEQALAAYDQALALQPENADALVGRGTALHELARYDEEEAVYHRALTHRPGWALPEYNLGLLSLLRGDLAAGWMRYEARLRVPELAGSHLKVQGAPWNGEDLRGRSILIHAEQGLGDTIQFARYLPMVADRGGRITLMCHPELMRLLRGISGIDRLISLQDPPPQFDVHCSLLSLPRVFQTVLQNIPAAVPYLKAEKELQFRSRLNTLPAGLKIGLCWAGRKHHIRGRAIEPELFQSLSQIGNISFISLQKGESIKPSLELVDWTTDLRDLADTAALVENLDLVISVDTAVAHLASALGKPVWVFLPHVPDWRWMLEREDSPWYPTMRLFRQTARGDWAGPIGKLVEALKQFKDAR